MKVKEVIEQLQKYDGEQDVYIKTNSDNEFDFWLLHRISMENSYIEETDSYDDCIVLDYK
ncbi:MAG: hypothetical protein ACYDCP_11020 [Thermoplasmataceae archaeon]